MKFRVKELSLIGNELKQPGDIIDSLPEGTLPAENLEPLDDEAKAKAEEYVASNAARVKQMIEQNQPGTPGTLANPEAFAAALAGAIKQLVADGVLIAAAPAKDEEAKPAVEGAKDDAKPAAGGKPAGGKPAGGKGSGAAGLV